jgi:hypothetical protein
LVFGRGGDCGFGCGDELAPRQDFYRALDGAFREACLFGDALVA